MNKLLNVCLSLIGMRQPTPPAKQGDAPLAEEAKRKYGESLKDWYEGNKLIHVENAREARKALDQAILVLSSAAFGLAITLLQLVNGPVYQLQSMQASWALFGVATAITLVSYVISEHWSEHKLDQLHEEYIRTAKQSGVELEEIDAPRRWRWIVSLRGCLLTIFSSNMLDILNFISLGCFLAGLLFLSNFCWVNVLEKQKVYMTEEKRGGNNSGNQQIQIKPGTTKPNTTTDREERGLKPTTTSPKPLPPSNPADSKNK